MARSRTTPPVRTRRPRAPWRRWFPAIATLALLLLAPVVAMAQGAGADSVRLGWTAPGDDDQVGTAAEYDLRVATAPIDAGNWDAATRVTSVPAPAVAGTTQFATVRNLTRGTTYWFAIRTRDDAGNWSGISNVLRWEWVFDTAPPATPGGLAAVRNGAQVQMDWNDGAEPDLAGYHVYRAIAAAGPFTRLNGAIVSASQFTDASPPQEAGQVWYAVSAADGSGNESARSAAVSVTFTAEVVPSTAWRIETGYPNPARLGADVRIPIVVPDAGGDARLEIHDAAGRIVRRLPLPGLAPGPQVVTWDGMNDAGRTVAPGPFRAWLIAGDTRSSVRLARVP